MADDTNTQTKLTDGGLIGLSILITILWALLARQLHYHWGGESYYNYGWAIPFFSAFLFFRRISNAPELKQADIPKSLSIVGVIIFCLMLLLITPTRMLNEVNPFWRVPLMAEALFAFIASLSLIAAVGGRRMLLHLAFPCFFLLTMVPWPYQIEVKIVQGFTQATAEITVLIVQLLGHPASLMGNVISVGESQVGVDDACSGIRSLQALGMIALFLGEYFMLTAGRRVCLMLITLVAVITFNTARSITLTMIVLNGGTELYDKWHDPVGMITFMLSVLVLYGASELISMIGTSEDEEKTEKEIPIPTLTKIPRSVIAACTFFLLLPEIAVVGYFNYKESQIEEASDWSMDWPEEEEGKVEFLEISDSVKDILNYDFGERVRIKLNKDIQAEVYCYGYTGENPTTSVSSYGHSPTICMESAGARLISEVDPLNIEFEKMTLPLHHYKFVSHPRYGSYPIQVFWCIWERRNMGVDPGELTSTGRLKQFELLALGRRDYARKVVLIAVPGDHNPGTVRIYIAKLMNKIVKEEALTEE